MSDTIRVRALPGKEVPFHAGTATAPGGGLLVLRSSDRPITVKNTMFVRRRIKAGDLEIVNESPAKE